MNQDFKTPALILAINRTQTHKFWKGYSKNQAIIYNKNINKFLYT